jgi:hypothetical protein
LRNLEQPEVARLLDKACAGDAARAAAATAKVQQDGRAVSVASVFRALEGAGAR